MVSRADDPGSRPEGSTAADLAAASLELQHVLLDADTLSDQLAAIYVQIGQLEQTADLGVTSDATFLYQEAGDLATQRQQALDRRQSLTALIFNATSAPAPPTSTAHRGEGMTRREAFPDPPMGTAGFDEPPSGGDQFNPRPGLFTAVSPQRSAGPPAPPQLPPRAVSSAPSLRPAQLLRGTPARPATPPLLSMADPHRTAGTAGPSTGQASEHAARMAEGSFRRALAVIESATNALEVTEAGRLLTNTLQFSPLHPGALRAVHALQGDEPHMIRAARLRAIIPQLASMSNSFAPSLSSFGVSPSNQGQGTLSEYRVRARAAAFSESYSTREEEVSEALSDNSVRSNEASGVGQALADSFIDDADQPIVGAEVFELAAQLGSRINRMPADTFQATSAAAGNPPSMAAAYERSPLLEPAVLQHRLGGFTAPPAPPTDQSRIPAAAGGGGGHQRDIDLANSADSEAQADGLRAQALQAESDGHDDLAQDLHNKAARHSAHAASLLRDSDAAGDIPYELWPSVQNVLASAQWDQFDNTLVSIRASPLCAGQPEQDSRGAFATARLQPGVTLRYFGRCYTSRADFLARCPHHLDSAYVVADSDFSDWEDTATDEAGIRIDAQDEYLSHTRYLNHSGNPNCALVWISTPSLYGGYVAIPHIVVIAVIEPGSEMTFDYGPLFKFRLFARGRSGETPEPPVFTEAQAALVLHDTLIDAQQLRAAIAKMTRPPRATGDKCTQCTRTLKPSVLKAFGGDRLCGPCMRGSPPRAAQPVATTIPPTVADSLQLQFDRGSGADDLSGHPASHLQVQPEALLPAPSNTSTPSALVTAEATELRRLVELGHVVQTCGVCHTTFEATLCPKSNDGTLKQFCDPCWAQRKSHGDPFNNLTGITSPGASLRTETFAFAMPPFASCVAEEPDLNQRRMRQAFAALAHGPFDFLQYFRDALHSPAPDSTLTAARIAGTVVHSDLTKEAWADILQQSKLEEDGAVELTSEGIVFAFLSLLSDAFAPSSFDESAVDSGQRGWAATRDATWTWHPHANFDPSNSVAGLQDARVRQRLLTRAAAISAPSALSSLDAASSTTTASSATSVASSRRFARRRSARFGSATRF